MRTFLGVMGWAVALVAGAAIVLASIQSVEVAKELEAERREVLELNAQVESLTERRAALAGVQHAEMDSPLLPVNSTIAPAEPAPDSGAMAEAWAEGLESIQEDKEEDSESILDWIGSLIDERFIRMAAKERLVEEYGDLLLYFELPSEQEEQVRSILLEHLISEEMATSSDYEDFEELEKAKSDAEKKVRADLARVLAKEEMDYFEEYESGMEERLLRRSAEESLLDYASGLTDENRRLVRDVLVEETIRAEEIPPKELESLPDNPDDFTMDTVNNMLVETERLTFQRTRDRVAAYLDADQLAEYDRYVEGRLDSYSWAMKLITAFVEDEVNEKGADPEED